MGAVHASGDSTSTPIAAAASLINCLRDGHSSSQLTRSAHSDPSARCGAMRARAHTPVLPQSGRGERAPHAARGRWTSSSGSGSGSGPLLWPSPSSVCPPPPPIAPSSTSRRCGVRRQRKMQLQQQRRLDRVTIHSLHLLPLRLPRLRRRRRPHPLLLPQRKRRLSLLLGPVRPPRAV